MMKLEVIENPNSAMMQTFYSECKGLGFENNSSAQAIKYEWAVNERKGRFWGLSVQGRLVSFAGCHLLTEIGDSAFRLQFRGCELPGADLKKTLSKGHFNASTFRELLPYQIEYAIENGAEELFISVNHGNKNHRAMALMERQGYLEYYKDLDLFYTPQTLWKFNAPFYLEQRKKVKSYVG